MAEQKALAVWQQLLDAWELKVHGQSEDAEIKFRAAKNLAQARGFNYLPSTSVAQLPLAELLNRVEAISVLENRPDTIEAGALLGAVPAPKITISRALELYWEHTVDLTLNKDDDQVRRWKNPKRKAIQNLINLIGDKPISKITRHDMIEFRKWWIDRIKEEGLTPNSANKDFTHASSVLRVVNDMEGLGLDLPLYKLSLKDAAQKKRPSFSTAWIKEQILKEGALTGLNGEAKCLLLGMINTGYRPSEAANLTPPQIRLDADTPHISIEPVERELKSEASRRELPLVGVSLEAFRNYPGGFPRYRGKDSLSATVNKFLRENGLLETPDHTMYSLRHSFEDRMIAAEVDDRIRRDLFGHTLNHQRYGQGATLEHKARILQSIAVA
ncbi:tyrosine-type recombinase/integrase [Ruegeria sp. HU-ET01832]